MDSLPLAPPYLGVNDEVPLISLQNPYAANILNFNVTPEGLKLRKGNSIFATITIPSGSAVQRMAAYGDSNLFVCLYNGSTNTMDFVDVEAGTTVHSSAASGFAAPFPFYFNKYLFWLFGTTYNPGFYYNGSAWGNIGYTGSGLIPVGGCGFNSRPYLIQRGEAAYWYGPIDAISGALTKVDLSSIFSEKCELACIATFTLSDASNSPPSHIAFIADNGEVLFYTGSYPNSANWQIAGRANISQPLWYQTVVPYQGDTLVLTDLGVVSLRDLFLQGSEQAQLLSINTRIQEKWIKLVTAIRVALSRPSGPLAERVSGVWDKRNGRIVINFPYHLDADGAAAGGGFQFIFNGKLKAWYFHSSESGANNAQHSLVRYKNEIRIMGESTTKLCVWTKEGASGFTDRDRTDSSEVGYDYEILSAPVSGARGYVQQCQGMDVIIKSDLYEVTNYQLIKTLGVGESTAQKIPSQGASLQMPFVNMGIVGPWIQYKISGTTVENKTVGLEFYGSNFWINRGGSPR